MKRKIGIMGGTFDPIHIGHMLAAESVRETLLLDEIWFMPSYAPPHKNWVPVANAEQRLEMVRRAVEDHPNFQSLDIELQIGGISYTYITIRELCLRYHEDEFFFIIGGDMVEELKKWKNIEELLRMISFIGLQRAGQEVDWSKVPANIMSRVTMVPMPAIGISSTEIRQRCKNKQSIRYMVHQAVLEYIRENQLYET